MQRTAAVRTLRSNSRPEGAVSQRLVRQFGPVADCPVVRYGKSVQTSI